MQGKLNMSIMASVILAGLALAPTVLVAQAAKEVPSGTKRMAARLEKIAKETDSARFMWNNAERAAQARKDFEDAYAFGEAVQVRNRLASEAMLAGQFAVAAEEFRGLRNLFMRPELEASQESIESMSMTIATALLHLAEQESDAAGYNPDSHLMPMPASGVYSRPRAALAALEQILLVLEGGGDSPDRRWLLSLAYMATGGYPDKVPEPWRIPPAVFKSEHEMKRFCDVAAHVGLDVPGRAGGVVMEDFDGDGFLDVMVSSWGLRDQLRFFHNDGTGRFTERTKEAGLIGEVGGINLIQADYNNDGRPDVYVIRGGWMFDQGRHPNSLLKNNGDGTFEDVTEAAGLLSLMPTQVAAWGDYDNDGAVDLFVANEAVPQIDARYQLFRNKGDGTFTEVAESVGLGVSDFAKGAVWGDYDNDGLLDLYVSVLGQPNHLFHNDGPGDDGTWQFADVAKRAEVTVPISGSTTWFWDYDNDGWLDLFVATHPGLGAYSLPDLAAGYLGRPTRLEPPRVFRNLGDGTFGDMAMETRLARPLPARGANFGDLDNDGFLDCYLGTGDADFRTLVPNRMFRNDGGTVFQDVTTAGGFGQIEKGHAVAFGDIDNDGDEDVYAVMGGSFSGDVARNVLFENPGSGHRWITLKLEGVRSNRAALGARIKVTLEQGDGGTRVIHRVVTTGGSFGSSSLQQEIGLGKAKSIRSIEVIWPASNTTQTFREVAMDRFILVREGESKLIPMKRTRINISAGGCE